MGWWSRTSSYWCNKRIRKYLPGHPLFKNEIGLSDQEAVSAAPWGSAGILPIAYSYISMMGDDGLKKATQVANIKCKLCEGKIK